MPQHQYYPIISRNFRSDSDSGLFIVFVVKYQQFDIFIRYFFFIFQLLQRKPDTSEHILPALSRLHGTCYGNIHGLLFKKRRYFGI